MPVKSSPDGRIFPTVGFEACLSIAGSDPTCGAGMQADLKTFVALGTYPLTVIAAITAQNSSLLHNVWHLSTEIVSTQIDAVLAEYDPCAIKLGLLGTKELAQCVATKLNHTSCPLVLDPVLQASVGGALSLQDYIKAMQDYLLPITTVVTPNRSEAALLCGESEGWVNANLKKAAHRILDSGAESVIIKGGHDPGENCTDLVVTKTECWQLQAKKIVCPHTHGSGCTFASALAVFLGRGFSLYESAVNAKNFVTAAIESASHLSYPVRYGAVNQFFAYPLNLDDTANENNSCD